MLSGKRFKLEKATLALNVIEGKRKAMTIPPGGIILVVSGPTPGDGMVSVLWEGNKVEMFAIDVNVRGTEIADGASVQAVNSKIRTEAQPTIQPCRKQLELMGKWLKAAQRRAEIMLAKGDGIEKARLACDKARHAYREHVMDHGCTVLGPETHSQGTPTCIYEHWYIDCKDCGRRTTLEIYGRTAPREDPSISPGVPLYSISHDPKPPLFSTDVNRTPFHRAEGRPC